MYIFTVTYRLAGNLFDNKYYIPSSDVSEAKTKANSIVAGMATIQTPDVEYVSGNLTDMASPFNTVPVALVKVNGEATGETSPSITFLEFVFYPTESTGKITHRIRGFVANGYTDLGVWNLNSTGLGDPDGTEATGDSDAAYGSFGNIIAANSVSRSGHNLDLSTRLSVGSKRATRRL